MRSYVKAALAACAVASTLVPASAHASTSVGYLLIAEHSGKCLTASSSTPNAQVTQRDCQYALPLSYQTWYFDSTSSGWNQVRSPYWGRCLDVSNSNTANGTAILTYNCNDHTNQHWLADTLNPSTSGGVQIKSQVGISECLDISGYSTANGANALLWTCTGGSNERFKMVPVNALG